MACDPVLADQLREALVGHDVTEKRMFGGLAFLLDGRLAVAASGQGGLLVRTDPAEEEQLLREPGTAPMVMRGRPVSGWLHVTGPGLDDPEVLQRWVARAAQRVASLPPES